MENRDGKSILEKMLREARQVNTRYALGAVGVVAVIVIVVFLLAPGVQIMKFDPWQALILIGMLLVALVILVVFVTNKPKKHEDNGNIMVDKIVEEIPPDEIEAVIVERPEQLQNMELSEEAIKNRLEIIYTEHSTLFADSNGFFSEVEINEQYTGVVSLNHRELRLQFVYRYPTTAIERHWQKLYRDHISILNSRWRREESYRLRAPAYKAYIKNLRKHEKQIAKYITENDFIKHETIKNRVKDVQEFLNNANERDGHDNESVLLTEQVLQKLHILLDTIQPESIVV